MPEGHISIGNQERGFESRTAEAAPRETKIEKVAHYRAPAERSMQPGLETAAEAPVLDAWAGSFGVTHVLEVVFGRDDRVAVTEVRRNPWRQICALSIRAKTGREFVGTGWLIGPRAVATAGHCVYLHREGGFAESIDVIPARNGAQRPFGSFPAKRMKSVDGWIKEKRPDCDYGVIQLDDDIGSKLGWWEVRTEPDEFLLGTDANISGYPADRDSATRQYFHARKLQDVSPGLLYYRIDTFGGQSGSPVWQTTGDRACCNRDSHVRRRHR